MLAGIVVLHITTIILLLVATIDNVSGEPVIYLSSEEGHSPLWKLGPAFKPFRHFWNSQESSFIIIIIIILEALLTVNRCVYVDTVIFECLLTHCLSVLDVLCLFPPHVFRPGGSPTQYRLTCGAGGSWRTQSGITPTWKTTPRVKLYSCFNELDCWLESFLSHIKVHMLTYDCWSVYCAIKCARMTRSKIY